ncbi:MAG: methyltransferase domain-containing protein [Anaerolineae bacterium]|nr:methyltransferase domain-containing protein [Anaerolineae bacterium]
MHPTLTVMLLDCEEQGVVSADLSRVLGELVGFHEIITVTRDDDVVISSLSTSIARASSDYLLFLSSDFCVCKDWEWLQMLWAKREQAEVVLGSRYPLKPHSNEKSSGMKHQRNVIFRRLLDLDIHDFASGILLCRRDVLGEFVPECKDALMWVELLLHAHAQGYRIVELQLPSACVSISKDRRFTANRQQFIATLWRLWLLRNSIQCADYDARAFDSRIPFQRAWQRARYAAVKRFVPPQARTLDIGCGSSKILASLPEGSVGMDIQLNKLRFSRRYGRALANGDTFRLPFAAQSFDCVLSSQVIEHLPADDGVFDEMVRVLRPEGRLIIGTPDYHSLWPIIERLYGFFAPNAYADEHITHYYPTLLRKKMEVFGFQLDTFKYVFGAEWVGAFSRESRVCGAVEEA